MDDVFLQLKALLEPFGLTRYYTDYWGAYTRHLDPGEHCPGKRNTQKIERKQTPGIFTIGLGCLASAVGGLGAGWWCCCLCTCIFDSASGQETTERWASSSCLLCFLVPLWGLSISRREWRILLCEKRLKGCARSK